MPLVSGRSPAREVALWAFGLHSLAVAWVWWRWQTAERGSVLFWMDLPVSVAYAGLAGKTFAAVSFLAGGLWWAALAAGLTLLVGSSVRAR